MSVRDELIGTRFGRLVVTANAGRPRCGQRRESAYFVICDCGGERIIYRAHLVTGSMQTCGFSCDLFKSAHKPRFKHGYRPASSATRTYSSWCAMRTRCTNPNFDGWKNYGGRNVKVCERWMNSFEAFLADVGERPAGTTIGRFGDEGNYEPGNCKWMTRKEQEANKRRRK